MYQYFMEYELDIQKADHVFECAFDRLALGTIEVAHKKATGVFTESSEMDGFFLEEAKKFVQSAKEFFDKIIKTIQKLAHDLSVKVSVEIQKRKVQVKLHELKKSMVALRKESGEKITVIDTMKYYAAYNSYIATATAEYKKLYAREYASIEEYRAAERKADDIIEDKFQKLGLNRIEGYAMDLGISQTIDLTEKEFNNMKSLISQHENLIKSFVNNMKDLASKQDNAEKVQDIQTATSKISRKAGSMLKEIVDAPAKAFNALMRSIGHIQGGAGAATAWQVTQQAQQAHDQAVRDAQMMHQQAVDDATRAHQMQMDMHQQQMMQQQQQMVNNFAMGF